MVQEFLPQYQARSVSFGFEGVSRPRAATVSMCRYTVPQSPCSKPTASPVTSPPALILPPPGGVLGGLSRSISRISVGDERLASSAPSSTRVLSVDSTPFLSSKLTRNMSREASLASQEFTLLADEDSAPYEYNFERKLAHCPVGMDDQADSSPCGKLDDDGDESPQFSASPVLMSCLRDIARRPKQLNLS